MTVIAWDGHTLAADRLGGDGYAKNAVRKIFRHGGELLAVSGDLSVGMEMLAWYMGGAAPHDYPESNRVATGGASLVVIRPGPEVLKYEGPVPFEITQARCGFGSGAEAALTAMHLGATARAAVEVASIYCSGCGLGVDALEL